MTPASLARRARPLLGTLVEIGCDSAASAEAAVEAAFAAIDEVQRGMSRFEPGSDIARFNGLAADEAIAVCEDTAHVLQSALYLRDATDGLFDVSLGSAPFGWTLRGTVLCKLDAHARLDLGGIAKGHAVDRAIEALQHAGASRGWVNAGGDLRVFGDLALPVRLRDEASGGVRDFGTLADGALATSHLSPDARSQHARADVSAHVSVIAPRCLWADALTKVVSGGQYRPSLLQAYDARAWHH